MSDRPLSTPASTEYRYLYDLPVKTTLDINDQLLASAKVAAAQHRTTLTRLIEEGLQLRLRAQAPVPPTERVHLPVFKGGSGLAAGLNPSSNRSMLDALESPNESPNDIAR